MSRDEALDRVIEGLSPAEIAELAACLRSVEADLWDAQMDADAVAGRLDFLLEEARSKREAGQLIDWPAAPR